QPRAGRRHGRLHRDRARPEGPPVGAQGRRRLRRRPGAGPGRRGERRPGARAGVMSLPPAGATVGVSVPASTANLGPGFDAVGLGLGIRDGYAVQMLPADAGLEVVLEGEGAADLPADGRHLVARHLREALEAGGHGWLDGYGLRLTCRNRIPMSAGLGSSAAAIVSGLGLGLALA